MHRLRVARNCGTFGGMETETTGSKKPAVILNSPEDLKQARLNQPRVSLEEVRSQRLRHQQENDATLAEDKKETSPTGPIKAAAG